MLVMFIISCSQAIPNDIFFLISLFYIFLEWGIAMVFAHKTNRNNWKQILSFASFAYGSSTGNK